MTDALGDLLWVAESIVFCGVSARSDTGDVSSNDYSVETLSRNFEAYLRDQRDQWKAERKAALAPYASFWQRLAGRFIDGVLLGSMLLVLSQVLPAGRDNPLVLAATLAVVNLAYFAVGLHVFGRTLGGKLLGIRCADRSGQNPSWGASLGREAVPVGISLVALDPALAPLAAVFLALNYLSMLWQAKRQCWMDKAAGTFVLKDRAAASSRG